MTDMIRFRFDGPVAAGFALIGQELGPGQEFEVPEHLALAFDNHGLCVCLEPDKLAPLRDAEAVEQAAQDAARTASGLVNTHPSAPGAAAATFVPEAPAVARAKAKPAKADPTTSAPAPDAAGI